MLRATGDADAILCLSGDTPTTDRLFLAFETLTVPVVLASSIPGLLATLPTHVPWEDVWVVAGTSASVAGDEYGDVVKAMAELTPEVLSKKVAVMRQCASSVTWLTRGSVAHHHLMAAALRRSYSD